MRDLMRTELVSSALTMSIRQQHPDAELIMIPIAAFERPSQPPLLGCCDVGIDRVQHEAFFNPPNYQHVCQYSSHVYTWPYRWCRRSPEYLPLEMLATAARHLPQISKSMDGGGIDCFTQGQITEIAGGRYAGRGKKAVMVRRP